MRAAVILLVLAFALAGCAEPPKRRIAPDDVGPARHFAAAPEVRTDPLTGRRTMRLRVMTWNIAGLPAPLKSGRAEAIRAIGDTLGAWRAAGQAPHILLIQEGFMTSAMEELVARSGYRHVARGPSAKEAAPRRSAAMGAPWRLWGEGLGKLFGSGLYILSDYPILEVANEAYGDCAGFDCMANKGAMLARIAAPGAPAPIAVANTHLNARRAAKVPLPRTHLAHRLQIDALERFVAQTRRAGEALIFGGDFNMRGSEARWTHAAPAGPYAFARDRCLRAQACAAALPASEAGLRDTQDLQGAHDGAQIRIRPVRLAILDDRAGPEALSDHSAYLVEYELS